jgi:Kinesin motor domain
VLHKIQVQNGDEEGEINLLNSDYTTNRFAFTWSWWSAYGYDRHITSNKEQADAMLLMNQEAVYAQCGTKIKADLLDGNAVVLFAYGLSGSGKTYSSALLKASPTQRSKATCSFFCYVTAVLQGSCSGSGNHLFT